MLWLGVHLPDLAVQAEALHAPRRALDRVVGQVDSDEGTRVLAQELRMASVPHADLQHVQVGQSIEVDNRGPYIFPIVSDFDISLPLSLPPFVSRAAPT